MTTVPSSGSQPPIAPSPPSSPVQSRTVFGVWPTTLWLCVILMFGLLVMSRSKADPDLWGHVTYGKEVLRDGHLHDVTTWSYAVDDFRWVNHENIAELMMAAADSLGGQTALLLIKSLLTLVVLGLPVWAARQLGAGLTTCAAIVALLSLNISFHWLVRPHMLSYASAVALMALLATGLPGAVTARGTGLKFGRRLWLIPVVMCFWTNAHGGYLAGMAILVAWLGLDAMELLLRRDSRFWPTVRHHAMLFTVTVAACMINPYGMELHTWMLSSLGRPRPEISEWAPLPLFTVDGLPFWGLALGAFLCLKRSDQPIRWPGLIVMALLSWQAVKHHRHLPFVAMIGSFVLVPHLESTFRQMFEWFEQRVGRRRTDISRTRGSAGLLTAAALLIVLSLLQYPRQATLHVDKDYYPVGAMQYMADHQLEGKVFVTFNWAQYALAVFSEYSPDSRIAFDGRFRTCYPQHIIDMYFDFILGDLPESVRYREASSGPFDPTRALSYRSPDLVLFERKRSNCVATMEAAADDWCLLYQDSLAQLWGRRSIYDNPEAPDYLSPSLRYISDDLQEDTVAWPAFPARSNDRTQMSMKQPTVTR
ncbi:MAG: hypothetical protein RIK87_00735 [Fuerstiella sp.]